MALLLPTIADFKAQFARDFPFATPLARAGVVGAEATVLINDAGNVTGLTITNPGSGLGSPTPAVTIYGGGGVGARATATLTGGAVTLLTVNSPGIGYVTAPYAYLSLGGDDTDVSKVTDRDIASAFSAVTQFNITQRLLSNQAAFTYAYDLLAAHYLVTNLSASNTGLSGKADWLTKTRMVGNVSEGYDIPKRVLNSPYLSKLSKTTYGAQFLELMSPSLIGNVSYAIGDTLP